MSLDFIRFVAIDGVHFVRADLIKSLSSYDHRMYMGFKDDPVDVKSKLVYDNGDTIYFTEDVEILINQLKGLKTWNIQKE